MPTILIELTTAQMRQVSAAYTYTNEDGETVVPDDTGMVDILKRQMWAKVVQNETNLATETAEAAKRAELSKAGW